MKQQSKKCLDTLTTRHASSARLHASHWHLAPSATSCDWPSGAYPGIHSTDLWSRSDHTYKPQGPGGQVGQEGGSEGGKGWVGPDGASSLWALAFLQSGRAAGEPYTLLGPLAGIRTGTSYLPPKSLQAYLGASSGHLGLCASSRSPVPASHCSSHHAPAASCMARPCPIPTLPCLQVQVSSTQHPTTCSSVTITTTHHPSSLLSLPIFQPPHSSSPHSVPPNTFSFLHRF